MTRILIHQVYYDAPTRAAVDPGFIALDNCANARPDWREYWPIRSYFETHKSDLDAGAYYGFVSPKFSAKTGLASTRALGLATEAAAGDCDVILFSPAWDMGALFWNVFEQAAFFNPEFKPVAQQFVNRVHRTPIADLVMDTRNTVFSNYFLARPAFWQRWLEVTGLMFGHAEKSGDPLGKRLRTPLVYAPHAPKVEIKVFLMERMASFILATSTRFKAHACTPFALTPSDTVFSMFATEAIAADALKIAFATSGEAAYRTAFTQIQGRVLATIRQGPR